jgi:hypothetical protein
VRELLEADRTSPAALEQKLAERGLASKRAAVRAILDNYATATPRQVKAMLAQAQVVRAEGAARALQAQLREGGFPKAVVEVGRRAGKAVGAMASSPLPYLVIYLEHHRIVKELEEGKTGAEVAKDVATEVVAITAAHSALKVLAPGLASSLSKGLGKLAVVTAMTEVVASTQKAERNPLEGIALAQALGVPGAEAIKLASLNAEKVVELRFFKDESNDFEVLRDDTNKRSTYRTRFWLGEASPIAEVLSQLTGKAGATEKDLEGFDPRKVKTFRQPQWRTRAFLEKLGEHAKKNPELGTLPVVRTFDLAAWKSAAKRAEAEILHQVQAKTPPAAFAIDSVALATWLRQNDLLATELKLSPGQRAVLETRLKSEVEAMQRWVGIVNAMGAPVAEKRAALAQAIENLAANHVTNAMMFKWAQASSKVKAPDEQTNLDDFYTLSGLLPRSG